MNLEIITNNRKRGFVYRHDVPAKILKDQFGHLDEDEGFDGFFKYRGYWYHVSDFMRISNNSDLKGWDWYHSDSFFSGILIRLSNDGETFVVGRYYS